MRGPCHDQEHSRSSRSQSTSLFGLNSQERRVVNSRPFQRLRHIHQLALTYLVYPGATHRRFEHSLGVMELASRVFDVITNQDNVSNDIRELIDPIRSQGQLPYWKTDSKDGRPLP